MMADLLNELRDYLDTLAITGDNIGDIRRSCFMPWESHWNGCVRDETASREKSSSQLPAVVPQQGPQQDAPSDRALMTRAIHICERIAATPYHASDVTFVFEQLKHVRMYAALSASRIDPAVPSPGGGGDTEASLKLIEDILRRIESAYRGSIGSIENTYMPQIGVDEVVRWRARLAAAVVQPSSVAEPTLTPRAEFELAIGTGKALADLSPECLRGIRNHLPFTSPVNGDPSPDPWLPIETCPSDTLYVIAAWPVPNGCKPDAIDVGEAFRDDADLPWFTAMDAQRVIPTHWMPLPKPPSASSASAAADDQTTTKI